MDARAQPLERELAVLGAFHLVSFQLEESPQHLASIQVVLDDKHSSAHDFVLRFAAF